MYIWMILATFMVMLATFNLSPRADIEKVQSTPMAEASVTKFLAQHDAAINCATSSLRMMLSVNPEENTNCIFDNETKVTPITGCVNGVGDLCSYLPVGYKYEENAYYSRIYCLNGQVKNSHNEIIETGGAELEDCRTSVRYIITFGRVPQRWKNVSTNKILAPYYMALRSKIPMQGQGGVVIPKTEGDTHNLMQSDYVIQMMGLGEGAMDDSIPPYFLNEDPAEVNYPTFQGVCMNEAKTGLDPKFPCVIYITKI